MEVAGANIAEELSMRLADFLPLGDVGHKHARADDVFHAGANLLQCGFDILQGLHGLGVGVSHTNNLPVRSGCGGSRDMDVGSNLHCARVTHNGFPRCAAGDVRSFHLRDSPEPDSIRCKRIAISSRHVRVPTETRGKPCRGLQPPMITKNDRRDKQKSLAFVSRLG